MGIAGKFDPYRKRMLSSLLNTATLAVALPQLRITFLTRSMYTALTYVPVACTSLVSTITAQGHENRLQRRLLTLALIGVFITGLTVITVWYVYAPSFYIRPLALSAMLIWTTYGLSF